MMLEPNDKQRIEASIRYFKASVGPIPPEVAQALPLFVWDADRLHSYPAPVRLTPVVELLHFLDAPVWRRTLSHPPFTLSPWEVASDGSQHKSHYERAMACDLDYSIDIICLSGGWRLADGYHRLLKAKVLDLRAILTHLIPETAIPSILQDEDRLPPLASN